MTGSYGVFVIAGMIAICDGVPISRVCPSAGARATASAAIAPAAPGRFSTTNSWPKVSPSGWAISRAMPSVLPPGAKGTTDPHRLLRPDLRPCRLASDNGGDHDERREKHFLRSHDCVPLRSLYLRLRHLSARLDCKARAITDALSAARGKKATRKGSERYGGGVRRASPRCSRQAASRTRADQVR